MNIAIIGTGNVGGALATQWSEAGHTIYLGVRNVNDFKGKELLENARTSVYPIPAAIAAAEVILVASPPQFAETQATTFGDLKGKILIDATNAVRTKPENYPTAFHAFAALTEAEVVKCFNSTGFENMQNPSYGEQQLDMFMAGDSSSAKATAVQLAQDAGFENCYDFGDHTKVELLEQFALAWINLAIFQGYGRGIGFKVIRR